MWPRQSSRESASAALRPRCVRAAIEATRFRRPADSTARSRPPAEDQQTYGYGDAEEEHPEPARRIEAAGRRSAFERRKTRFEIGRQERRRQRRVARGGFTHYRRP